MHTKLMYYFLAIQPCNSKTVCNRALIILQNKALGIQNSVMQKSGFPKCIIMSGFCKSDHNCLILSRIHNKRREGEYPTLTTPCTNALHKICAINHWILLFCINTFRVTKDSMTGIDSFVVLCVQISISYCACE